MLRWWILKKWFTQIWNGFSWLRTDISRVLSVKTIMKSKFSERREVS